MNLFIFPIIALIFSRIVKKKSYALVLHFLNLKSLLRSYFAYLKLRKSLNEKIVFTEYMKS